MNYDWNNHDYVTNERMNEWTKEIMYLENIYIS